MYTQTDSGDRATAAEVAMVLVDRSGLRARKAVAAAVGVLVSLAFLDAVILIATIATVRR